MRRFIIPILAALGATLSSASATGVFEISAEELADRIRGAVAGQMIGNLNGLPHEFKYISDPGNVSGYAPSLPDGARTDDDTDIEWVHLSEIARGGPVLLPPAKVNALWKAHINDWIWSATDSARQLMDLNLEPPLTGRAPLNLWAEYNIAGQFVTDMMALGAPAMPATAAKIGTHYASINVDGEPLQCAAFFSAMLALAYVENDIEKIVTVAQAAAHSESETRAIISHAVALWRQYPQDWRAARLEVRDRYTRYGGVRPDINGYALNAAATILALLYGGGDFVKTLELAFNFGWDADNTAAYCGTLLGAQRGWKWMQSQGWPIKDVYRNNTRDGMPMDETITGYGDKVIAFAYRVISEHEGETVERDGANFFRIKREQSIPAADFVPAVERKAEMQTALRPSIARDLESKDEIALARAAYLATALGLAPEFMQTHPKQWAWAVQRLERHAPNVVISVFTAAEHPEGKSAREAFQKAGVLVPKQ